MRALIIIVCVFLFVGCAQLREATEDFKVGKSAELVNGEVSPKDSAKQISNAVGVLPIPYADKAAAVLGGLLTFFFTWQRGRRIRAGQPPSTNPATGFLGNAMGLEGLVQNLSSAVVGAFEVGKDQSSLKRAWKVGLSIALSVAGFAVAVPDVQAFVLARPDVTAGIVALASFFGALEKKVSAIKPVIAEPK
jgi:hypothetical protein